MKQTHISFFLYIIITLMFSLSIVEANRDDISTIDREIYVAKEQTRMLLVDYEREKAKPSNKRVINAYVKTIQKLQKKTNMLIRHRNQLIAEKRQDDLIEQKRVEAIERQIPHLVGDIKVVIDLSEQKMRVYKGETLLYNWLVSTARGGYSTPIGNYKPYHLAKMHYSKLYDNSPMPYSIFFKHGYAIHGTNYIRSLGRVASHGCVRLHPNNAKKLFYLVKSHGYNRTKIKITA